MLNLISARGCKTRTVVQESPPSLKMERVCCFWSIFENSDPPYLGAQKSFFCVKFPKTKPKTIFFSPKRLFQVFRLSTREMSFSNLALFENAQNLRDKFWNLVCENRVLASKRAPFCFWRVFRSVALRKKFDTDCDPLSRRNLAISLQIALISTVFSKVCLNLWWKWSFQSEKQF